MMHNDAAWIEDDAFQLSPQSLGDYGELQYFFAPGRGLTPFCYPESLQKCWAPMAPMQEPCGQCLRLRQGLPHITWPWWSRTTPRSSS